MTRFRRMMTTLAAAVALVIAIPAVAMAEDTTTGDTTPTDESHLHLTDQVVTSTLTVLGAPLTVTVTMDSGAIASVALDPAGTPPLDPIKETDHKVVYQLQEGTYVLVKAGPHGVKTKIRSDSPEGILGSNSWSADVFGTGVPVTIPYEIAMGTDGLPMLTVGTPTDGGVTAVVGDPKTRESDHGAKTRVVVSLTSGEDRAWVLFKVSIREKDDGTTKASVSVSLVTGRYHHRHDDHQWAEKDDDGDRADRWSGDHSDWDGRRDDRDGDHHRDGDDDENGSNEA